jgi:HlyD family secretion protein
MKLEVAMHKIPKKLIIIPVALLIAVAGTAWWYIDQISVRAEDDQITASGTIEATQIEVAPEIGGQITEVLAQAGESIHAGQELVVFTDALLEAQMQQVLAASDQAEANYEMVAAGLPVEQQELAIAAAELELISAQQVIDELYDKNELAAAQAAKAVADARDLERDAQMIYDSLRSPASQTDIDIAQSLVTLTEAAIEKAEKRFKTLLRKAEDNPRRAAVVLMISTLEKQHDLAVKRLNYLEGTADEITLAQSEANLELAQQSLEDTQQQLDDLQEGPDPDTLALAQARLKTAEANLAAAQAGPSQEQLALARSQVEVARAAVGVLDAQRQKLSLAAPVSGVVLSRSVEPGEVAAPGAPLMILAKLDDLKITVYIPEDRYGRIKIGQQAQVFVDSFPGEIFTGVVVSIADQAEFTPRNVQTEEGRRTTVFAVELKVENPDGRLKPGMPADVSFEDA